MTYAEVITKVRQQISDTVATYRWSEAILYAYLSDGIRQIVYRHPEAMYVSSVVVTAPVEVATTDGAETLQIVDIWANPLVQYIKAMVFGEDSEDAANRILANDAETKEANEMS